MNAAAKIGELLDLAHPPVAVRFREDPPEGVARIDDPAVSGCTYWKLASEGRTFYTTASDHFGCPVGSYTHGIELPEAQAAELEGMVGTMVQLEYLTMEEVPEIPRRSESFGVAVYAPATDASDEDADAVLIHGNAKQMMLLAESARAAGVPADSGPGGRPTCAAIPSVMTSGGAATNLGCIGNRVYTGLDDDELYFVIAGSQLDAVAARLATIVKANTELEKFHRGRLPQ